MDNFYLNVLQARIGWSAKGEVRFRQGGTWSHEPIVPCWCSLCVQKRAQAIQKAPSRGIPSASLAGNCDYTLQDML